MRIRGLILLALALAAAPASAQQTTAPAASAQRMVMTWIPPYAIDASLAQLKALHSGEGPSKALTHIALQFWHPTSSGGVTVTNAYDPITPAQIKRIVAWGHNHGIKVVLCVYNFDENTQKWDWAWAKSAFATHRAAFAANLAAEMNRLGLDGIDIDFEGDDNIIPDRLLNKDKTAYVAFVKTLRAKTRGKHLTIDSFSDQYNAPNWNWWTSLFPYVNGITSMGYQYIGMNAPGGASYASQRRRAGANAPKLMLGLPSDRNTWQGNNANDQTHWFVTTTKVGVAIWDAQFTGSLWRQAPVWQNLRAVSGR
ncbi:MAG TPA: glycosyl hydrolase family 18 protein [Pseudolabrys sp.]|nr:glycosyl hydrolase family 18 protein [Pseudolabrys sp.]